MSVLIAIVVAALAYYLCLALGLQLIFASIVVARRTYALFCHKPRSP